MQYKQKLWLFIVRKSQAFETIRKRILSRFLLFNEKSTGLHTYLLSYQRKSDGEGTQTFLKLERQYFQDFFNGWSTEHDSIIISKKVWQKKKVLKHYLSQTTSFLQDFYLRIKPIIMPRKFWRRKYSIHSLNCSKEQHFQGFHL